MKAVRRNKADIIRKYIAICLIIAGAIGLAVTIFISLGWTKLPGSKPGAIEINAAPSSVKPSAQEITNYSVPPTDPRYIAIPSIKLSNTPVLKLGLLPSGVVATPDNIYYAGWYSGSTLPGKSGAMFIYGHVSSWTANGIFYDLKKLLPGDKVVITRGDNTVFTYKVVEARTYPYNHVDMGQVLSPIEQSSPGLNLMTCTGHLIKGTSEFSERLVVFTSLDNS